MSINNMKEDILSKIVEYSNFIENVLNPELRTLESEMEIIQSEMTEYQDLGKELNNQISIDNTSNRVVDVDLGYETIYCKAVVEDPSSTIHVHVGMGFHVELSIVEAIEFVKKRINHLKIGPLSTKQTKISEVKSHIDSAKQILYQLDRAAAAAGGPISN